ncbi:MAG: long-chain fatty acid--CoA ligase [Actinomycetota bacterium]
MTSHRPWFASYPEGVPHTLEPYPERSLFSLLEEAVGSMPDRTAIAFFGKHTSYGQLLAEAERFSAVLASLGVQRGDRVAFVMPNCPQLAAAFFGAQRLGAIAVPNNPLYTPRELSHQLTDCGARVVLVLDQLYPLLEKAREGTEVEHVIVTKVTDAMKFPLNLLAPLKFKKEAKAEGKPWPPVPADADVLWWRDVMRGGDPLPPAGQVSPREDAAALVYTGGTTGVSKGAMLSHFNIVSNAMQAKAWITTVGEGTDVVMLALPLFHSYGLMCFMFAVITKNTTVMVPRFELGMVLKQLAKEKVTLFPGVPRMYLVMNEAPETRKFDLRSVKICVSGAAPLPLAVARRFEEVTGGAQAVEGYGLTETSPVTHVNPIEGVRKEGSIGLPLPDTDCKIVDLEDPEHEMGAGEPGELCMRGPQVMLGYWNRPEETAAMIRNGWLHSGDVAQFDEQGYFSIVDRLKDMVIVSGFNVYPTAVEEALYRHPKILKAAVIGVPDDVTGEALKAFVVLRPGETATAQEIVAWCRDPEGGGLTAYRVPKQIEFRDSLPETLIGKVLRRVLQEEERAKR